MGRWSPGQLAKANLDSFTIATGAVGSGNSTVRAPVGATKWNISQVAATAPGGTDGALIFYKHAVVDSNLIGVVGIGEKTSDDVNIPFLLDSLGANDLVVRAEGVTPGVGNVVTVVLIGVAY